MNYIFLRALHSIYKKYYRGIIDISQKDFSRDMFLGEEKKEVVWPGGARAAFNLQFDDFCGHSKKNSAYDYGGSCGEGIHIPFDDLLARYPFLKVTLFAIPNARFQNREGLFYGVEKSETKFDLSQPQFSNLVSWINGKSNQVEIACHGYQHVQQKTKLFLAPAEFEFDTEKEAQDKIEKALSIFQKIKIPIHGFRAPMWGIGYNRYFEFLQALQKFRFAYVALSSPLSGLNWDKKRVSNIYPSVYEGFLNIPQNISLSWDIERIKKNIDRIIEYRGVITVMGHYNKQYDWMNDGIGEESIEKINRIVEYLQESYAGHIYFATLSDIARVWNK